MSKTIDALRKLEPGVRIEIETAERSFAGELVSVEAENVTLEIAGRHRAIAIADVDDVILSASTAPQTGTDRP